MPLLSAIDPAAAEIGAVNTVLCDEKRGYNTDAAGFMGMLLHYALIFTFGFDVKLPPIAILSW